MIELKATTVRSAVREVAIPAIESAVLYAPPDLGTEEPSPLAGHVITLNVDVLTLTSLVLTL
jgi:hypothetical protein